MRDYYHLLDKCCTLAEMKGSASQLRIRVDLLDHLKNSPIYIKLDLSAFLRARYIGTIKMYPLLEDFPECDFFLDEFLMLCNERLFNLYYPHQHVNLF